MNKKDIAQFRRELKPNNDKMQMKELFNLYIMKDSADIFHEQSIYFDRMEEEEKDLFMMNFKKVLTGQVDEKLFTLKFRTDVQNETQLTLHEGLLSAESEDWKEKMRTLAKKIIANQAYEEDMVMTFIRGEYAKTMKRDADDQTTYSHPFILCSMNKTKTPDHELIFDYVEKEFKYNVMVDPIIDLSKPVSGFLFPCIIEEASDVNHILYSAKKKYELDYSLIEDVLLAEEVMTKAEDKAVFEEIVNKVAGDQLDTKTLANVYDEINDRLQLSEEEGEEDAAILTYKDVEHVLSSSGVVGVEGKDVADAFELIIDDKMHELKAENVIPKYNTKSIKIETKLANVVVSPEDLRYVRQVTRNGKLYLMIELEENTNIEGFEMIPEDQERQ